MSMRCGTPFNAVDADNLLSEGGSTQNASNAASAHERLQKLEIE